MNRTYLKFRRENNNKIERLAKKLCEYHGNDPEMTNIQKDDPYYYAYMQPAIDALIVQQALIELTQENLDGYAMSFLSEKEKEEVLGDLTKIAERSVEAVRADIERDVTAMIDRIGKE